MGNVLNGDQQREFARKLGEIQRQLGQAEYPYNPIYALAALQAVIEGRFNLGRPFPSQVHCPELIPTGWEVVEDVEPSEVQVNGLEFIPFLRSGENDVSGEEMRQRAQKINGVFGLTDAPMFLAQQADIPAEVLGKYIPLTGTVLRDPVGNLDVPYLHWRVGWWFLGFGWLDGRWGGFVVLPRPK